MIGRGDLPGGNFYSRGYAVSANGSFAVGIGNSASGDEAFLRAVDIEPIGMQ